MRKSIGQVSGQQQDRILCVQNGYDSYVLSTKKLMASYNNGKERRKLLIMNCTQVFITDMANFAEMNGEYAKWFSHKPARSCVAVAALPLGVPVEIECKS